MTQPLIREQMSKQDAAPLRTPWHQNDHLLFLLFNVIYAAFYFDPLRELFVSSWKSGYTTYIPFIPIISFYVLYTDRVKIFSQKRERVASAIIIVVLCAILYGVFKGGANPKGQSAWYSLTVIVMLLTWIGGFLSCYGGKTFKAAAFPLGFLFFAVPIPKAFLDAIISFLQTGSAEVAFALIKWSGVPVVREGFVFQLPTMNIEVAPQCSGIRSALSLVIVGSLAAYLFLRKGWARAILLATLLPIAVVKNGLRIAVLVLLSVHVDPGFLEGDLHQRGGMPFFVLALLMAGGVIFLLRKQEMKEIRAQDKTGTK